MSQNSFNIFKVLTPKDETVILSSSLSLLDTLKLFEQWKFAILPLIAEDGEYIGTVSEGDLLRFAKDECEFSLANMVDKYVIEVPRYRSYKPVKASASFKEVFDLILEQNFVPVLDDRGKFIGIIKRKDVLLYTHPFEED